MAKAKQKKMLAMALAASVAMSAVPVVAFAEGTEESVSGGETASEGADAKDEVTVTKKTETEIKNEDGSTTTKTDADLSNGAKITIEVTVKEDTKTDTDGKKETITDTTTKNWSGEITSGNQNLIGKDSFIENQGETEENNGTTDGTTKPSFSTDPTGKGGSADVNGNEKTDDAMDDLVNNFKGQDGTKDDKTLVDEGEKTTFSGSEEKTDTDVKKNDKLKAEYGQLSGENKSTTTTVKKEQYSETVPNDSEETKPTLSEKDKGTPDEKLGEFTQVGETTKEDTSGDYSTPKVEYGGEMELEATVTPTDTVKTTTEYLKDWTTLYKEQVENVKQQVLEKAKAEAQTVTAADGTTALEMKQDTDAEKVAGSEETYVYKGMDGTTKVVKTVYVKKETDDKGNVTFTTYVEEVRTPNYTQTNEKFDPEQPGDPAASDTTYTFDAEDTVTREETILPTKPTEGESFTMAESGETATTTKVEEITDEDGKVVGYKRYFVVTDAEGKELKSGSEEIRATQKTTTETVKKTETTDKTYTETIIEERIVTKTSSTETVTMNVDTVYRELVLKWLGATAGGTGNEIDGAIVKWESLVPDLKKYVYTGTGSSDEQEVNKENSPDADQLQYLRQVLRGLTVNIKEEGKNDIGIGTWLYWLKGKTATTEQKEINAYGYCVDLAVDAEKGYYYDIENLYDRDDNAYQGTDKAESLKKIENIALNGFWGTASGTGSLENVKSVLESYLKNTKEMSPEQAKQTADSLQWKEALTATQLALWKFGNSDTKQDVKWNDILTYDYTGNETTIKLLIDALINVDARNETNEATNILDEKDIKATVIVKDKVADAEENKDDDPDNDVFNTTVKFTLAVVPTADDDLVVCVYNGDEWVTTKRIAGTAQAGDEMITPDGNTYTISDIQLQEGVNINLKLSGTQFLQNGVYIYSSEYIDGTPSQSFVTVAQGTRKVNLDVAMKFEVTDPKNGSISGSKKTESFSRNDKKTTENIWREKDQIVTALVEVTTETITTSSSEWSDEYSRKYKKDSDKEEDKEEKEEDKEEKDEDKEKDKDDEGIIAGDSEDIDDSTSDNEEVTKQEGMVLAAKTNDAAVPWAAAGGFSLLGLLGTLLFGRRKNANR